MAELSAAELMELDELYTIRDASGNPTHAWGVLVEELRKIRRTVEAGEVVQIAGGPALQSVLDFHTWEYNRYKLLEEGWDSLIGNDD
jgi:hypothetical protein